MSAIAVSLPVGTFTTVEMEEGDEDELYINYGGDGSDTKTIEKTRERNREHAKKTRLRKKALLENMKGRLLELQEEAARLNLQFEESNTANILLCLGSGCLSPSQPPTSAVPPADDCMSPVPLQGNIIDQLRHKVRSEAAECFKAQGGLNNKRPLSPEHLSSSQEQQQQRHRLCSEDLSNGDVSDWEASHHIDCEFQEGKKTEDSDVVRKERNRMHAKLTRDRKKLFTSELQQLINSLERQNAAMRNRLKCSSSPLPLPSTAMLGYDLSSNAPSWSHASGFMSGNMLLSNHNYNNNYNSNIKNSNDGSLGDTEEEEEHAIAVTDSGCNSERSSSPSASPLHQTSY